MIISLLSHRHNQGRHLQSVITAIIPNKASMALQIDHTEKPELPTLVRYIHHCYPRKTHTDQQVDEESLIRIRKLEGLSLGYELSFGYVKFGMPKGGHVQVIRTSEI